MRLKDLPKVSQEFLKQNDYKKCECCDGRGYGSFTFNICRKCIGACKGCIFLDRKGKVKLTKVDICNYCSGTGYRTWIDEIKYPYPRSGEEWIFRDVPSS